MIEITELDDLLNTLETSALEPHDEYKMEFTNKEQRIIHEYIKSLQKENQHLKEELNTCMIERNKFLDIIEETINKCKLEIRASSYQYEQRHKQQDLVYKVAHERILDILQKYKGDSNE